LKTKGLFTYISKEFEKIHKERRFHHNMQKSLCYHPGKSMSDKDVTKDLKIMEVVGDLYSLNPFQCSI